MTDRFKRISQAEVILSENLWEKTDISKNEKVFTPKYMLRLDDCKNIYSIKKAKTPYIYCKSSNNVIISIEASAGGVRELPVFYTIQDNKLFISDSPHGLIQNSAVFDEQSINEFLVFGYVLANRTLFKNIYSLQASETLQLIQDDLAITMDFSCYSDPVYDLSYKELIDMLLQKSEDVFHDIIKAINGRPVTLSLSAGYDSRFIASMLKMGGVEDVTCYAWGTPESLETKTSKAIAAKLGYKWEMVENTARSWEETINGEWFFPMLMSSSKGVSISGAASFPFGNLLKNKAENSIVFSGIGGGLLGSRIPQGLNSRSKHKDVLDFVLKYQVLNPRQKTNRDALGLTDYYKNYFYRLSPPRFFDFLNHIEHQAKFFASVNRHYEFHGCGWASPLYDYRIVDLFSKTPASFKRSKLLYMDFLRTKIFNKVGVDFDMPNPKRQKLRVASHFSFLKRVPFLKKAYRSLKPTKTPTDKFGFNYALPQVYQKCQYFCPKGYEQMIDYCNYFGLDKPTKEYEYLSRAVLAMTLGNH